MAITWFGFFCALLVACAVVAYGLMSLIIRMLRRNREADRLRDEEARLLQEIAASLGKMEGRIENLETILHSRVEKK
ncbi:MAG: hypothetical protein ABFD69_00930 [Candidatus Sumerlaeia bacterium]